MSHARVLAEKILVADDDRTTRFAISSVLKKAGYAVTAVKDGAEALRNIQQTSFDLVFLDIWMPELTGLEVLARVRAGESHPKIVIMTSDGTPETLLRAIREQAYEYLSKPFPPKEAVEVAQRALKQNAFPPIEVISARPHWLELLIPCTREAAERACEYRALHRAASAFWRFLARPSPRPGHRHGGHDGVYDTGFAEIGQPLARRVPVVLSRIFCGRGLCPCPGGDRRP